jgi:hypothetical protein
MRMILIILVNPDPIHFFLPEKQQVKFEVSQRCCRLQVGLYVAVSDVSKDQFDPEDEGIMSHRNVGSYSPNDTALTSPNPRTSSNFQH